MGHWWAEIEAFAANNGGALLIAGVVAIGMFSLIPLLARLSRRSWSSRAPRILGKCRVIDGDTIDDLVSSIRYRLANIDAPEIEGRCFKQRERADLAKQVAIQLIENASEVAVIETGRIDRYRRRVAFILVDGMDLGMLLVERGLALPWTGRREKWCGPKGGLAKIARRGAMPHSCAKCARWA